MTGNWISMWEYRTIDLSDVSLGRTEVEILNVAGRQGWELVTIRLTGIAYMKRPVIETSSKAPKTAQAR